MKITKLETKEQFDQLKKGDLVIAEWKDYAKESKDSPITSTKIWGINGNYELILNSRTNSYFCINRYLNGESACKEAFKITVD